MRFLEINFLNVQGVLAQKIYNAHSFFVNLLALKIRDDPNNQGLWFSGLLVNPNQLELAVLRKADLTF